jgi:hypothetical protein
MDRSHTWVFIISSLFGFFLAIFICDNYLDKVVRRGHIKQCEDICEHINGFVEIGIDKFTVTCLCWSGEKIEYKWGDRIRK